MRLPHRVINSTAFIMDVNFNKYEGYFWWRIAIPHHYNVIRMNQFRLDFDKNPRKNQQQMP